jgi:quercetin dioxygenase-like cupin family protein
MGDRYRPGPSLRTRPLRWAWAFEEIAADDTHTFQKATADADAYNTRRGEGPMLRKTVVILAGMALLGVALVGGVIATPASGITAETSRGPLVDRQLNVNMQFDGSNARVHLQTKAPMDVAQQRIVAQPGATFGWHTHPGPTIVTVLSGSLSFYHAEHCTERINYAPGQSFSNLPHEVHLARNEGTTTLVIYAVYFIPSTTPPTGLRIDQPSPGPGCPQ